MATLLKAKEHFLYELEDPELEVSDEKDIFCGNSGHFTLVA